jgi:hypothetical protein
MNPVTVATDRSATKDKIDRCVGYSVESADGRIGTVAAVLVSSGGDRVLLVKKGMLMCSLSAIPSGAVESVHRGRRCVVIQGSTPSAHIRRSA